MLGARVQVLVCTIPTYLPVSFSVRCSCIFFMFPLFGVSLNVPVAIVT